MQTSWPLVSRDYSFLLMDTYMSLNFCYKNVKAYITSLEPETTLTSWLLNAFQITEVMMDKYT